MKSNTGILFDFDDTLVETTFHFYQAQDEFAKEMAKMGFAKEKVVSILEKKDIENVLKSGGYHKHCFPEAIGQTYQYFCELKEIPVCHDTMEKMKNIGWNVFEKEPIEIPGAKEVVANLAEEFPLFLVTKGDPEIQLKRIKDKGFDYYFKNVYVVSNQKDEEFTKIIRENNLIPGQSWMIGNSMKSDINPALKQGIRGIHVVHPDTWSFEEEEPIGKYFEVEDIKEVITIIRGSQMPI